MSKATDEAREAAWKQYRRIDANESEYGFAVGFDAGYDARDAKTCVWAWGDAEGGYYVECVGEVRGEDERGKFCDECGGRIVTEAK